jgi:serine/threonine protein kinase
MWMKGVRLGNLIAKGGFSSVYEGHTEEFSISSSGSWGVRSYDGTRSTQPPDCAVKVFRVTPRAPAAVMQTLVDNEVRALLPVQKHPSAVRLLAVGQLQRPHGAVTMAAQGMQQQALPVHEGFCLIADGAPAIVMELLPQSLAGRLREQRGPLPEAEVQMHMRRLLTLLDDLHSGRCGPFVVHRDVKPANMLLRADGSLAMADWGFASVSDPTAEDAAMPEMSSLLGTPAYVTFEMAAAELARQHAQAAVRAAVSAGVPPNPADLEQLSSYKYDCSVDIHAAGISCMELLVGGLGSMFHGLSGSWESVSQWRERVRGFIDHGLGVPMHVAVFQRHAPLSGAAVAWARCVMRQ